jgi:hypothetical protein
MQYAYPTPEHAAAADAVVAFFARRPEVDAVLLVCSCARGKATPDSCLDVTVLTAPEADPEPLWDAWSAHEQAAPVFHALRQVGAFSNVDLDLVDGVFTPDPDAHGWTTGPDDFELEIGNVLAYSVPLWERNDRVERLRAAWLPYYDDDLRAERLAMVRRYCLNNLDHIPLYAPRGLAFQCLARLRMAYGEFLQALFIARRTYPIAYDKWIREQLVEILDLPEVYTQSLSLFQIEDLESDEIVAKANRLRDLLETYAASEADRT